MNEDIIKEATGLEVESTLEGTKKLPIMEIFGPTIQGEGPAVGEQTFFIRFGGCDYRCQKCDSMHAVIPALIKENATYMTVADIFDHLIDLRNRTMCSSVTLSGGNPLIYDITNLITILKLNGFKIHVETQATIFRPWVNLCNSVVLSPKAPGMGERFEKDKLVNFIGLTDTSVPLAVKIVVFSAQDIDHAAMVFHGLTRSFGQRCSYFLSLGNSMPPSEKGGPVHEGFERDFLIHEYRILMEDILQDVRMRDVRVLPQVHVLLWGNARGV
jgi:7-carboxy-7-deazaguanine synthase